MTQYGNGWQTHMDAALIATSSVSMGLKRRAVLLIVADRHRYIETPHTRLKAV